MNDEILVIYIDMILRPSAMQQLKDRIKKEMSEGLVILPGYAKPILCPKNIEVRIETEADNDESRAD